MKLAAFAPLSAILVACASAPPPPIEEPTPPARASTPASEPAPASAPAPGPAPSSTAEPRAEADAPPPPPTSKSSLRGSSMSASSMTVDGTSFSSLECDLGGGGGLLGPIAMAKGVSLQKSALDACVKKKTETTVDLTSAGGTFTKVKASGSDPAVNRCVEKALRGKQAAIPGSCTMIVEHGK